MPAAIVPNIRQSSSRLYHDAKVALRERAVYLVLREGRTRAEAA
jgi:hypothetical protein